MAANKTGILVLTLAAAILIALFYLWPIGIGFPENIPSNVTSSAPVNSAKSTIPPINPRTSSTTSIIISPSTVQPTQNCATPSDPNYTLQYETSHWYVYAYNSTWDSHKGYYLSQMGYLDQVYGTLSSTFGINPGRLYLLINQHTGGGFATSCIGEIGHGPGIGIAYDAWYEQYSGNDNWSVELIAHESTNVFTGYVVSGWPRDWWADDKSPFPFAIKILIERATGHTDAANASTNSADILTQMFLGMQNEYPGIYGRLFSNISNDSWTSWFGPNPSKGLSDYVAAYLSIASGTSLSSRINSAFAREGGFNYTINSTAVNAIIMRRSAIESLPKNGKCWKIFRSGNFSNVSC